MQNSLRKAGSVCCVLCLLCAFINNFIVVAFGKNYGSIVSIAATLILCLLGYSFSALFGKVERYERPSEDFEKSNPKYFSPGTAVLPILCVVICLILFTLAYRRYRLGIDRYIDEYSLELYYLPIAASLVVLCGVVLWFYPYHVIVNRNSIIAYFIGFLISFIIALVFEVNTVFLTVCFAIFLLLFFILCNQRCYERFFSSSRSLEPEERFGRYNLKLAIRHYIITIACFALVFSLCVLIGSAIKRSDNKPKSTVDENIEQEVVFEEKENEKGIEFSDEKRFIATEEYGDDSTVGLICGTVVIIGLSTLVLYLLFKKKPHLAIFAFLRSLVDQILEFLTSLFFLLFRKKYANEIQSDFTDKYVKFDVEYQFSAVSGRKKLSLKEFEERFNLIDDITERFAYVYGVYCRLLTMQGLGIKDSDTPREIVQKLNDHNNGNLNITGEFYEIIRYANKKAPEKELAKYLPVMKEMCINMIKVLS